jgi:hypothetical protein
MLLTPIAVIVYLQVERNEHEDTGRDVEAYGNRFANVRCERTKNIYMNGIAVDINGRFEIRTHTQFL